MAGRHFEDFVIGETHMSVARTITETDIVQFLSLSRNLEPQFNDREFYEKAWVFKTLAAPGGLTFVVASGLFTHLGLLSGTGLGFLGMDSLRLPKPLLCGDTLRVEVGVTETKVSRAGRGIVTFSFTGRNQDGEIVLTCTQVYVVASRAAAVGKV